MSEKFYDEFYRQRRNLILISVVLFFALSSGLTLNKFNVWGNEIVLKNPDGVLTFLWVVWAYWIWRFWVYALEYPNGFILSVKEEVKKSLRKKVEDIQYEDRTLKFSFTKLVYVYQYFRNNEASQITRTNYGDTCELSYFSYYNFLALTIIRVFLSHKSFTDQILPFLIALFPIIFIVWTKLVL